MSRRLVLLAGPAAALGALSACTGSEPAAPPVDPDRVTLEAALVAEEALAAAVAAWAFDSSELRVEALGVTDRHLSELQRALGTGSPTSSASPSSTATSGAGNEDDLLRVLDQTVDAHTRAIRRASTSLVPLLASIAASDAALAAAVRIETR